MGYKRRTLRGQTRGEQLLALLGALAAYVRHFRPALASDAVAAIYDDLAAAALRMMERNMDAELGAAADIGLG